jgi:hypothetical protein
MTPLNYPALGSRGVASPLAVFPQALRWSSTDLADALANWHGDDGLDGEDIPTSNERHAHSKSVSAPRFSAA